MMQMPPPVTRDVVLIGGGHAHALVLRMWGMRPVAGVRLTLISPDPTTAYTGMLPGHVAGHYPREALEIDLVRLARFAGARLVMARATGIDRDHRRVMVEGRAPVAYDVLSIDIGITTDMPDIPGFADHAVPAKPFDRFVDAWTAFAASPGAGPVAVIGAGLGGAELAMAAAHRLRAGARVTLIEAETPLAGVGRRARSALLAALDRQGVTVLSGARAARVERGAVHLADGRAVASDLTIGVGGPVAQGWLATTGLALQDGFVRVGPTLQTETDPAIFAVGDIAHLTFALRPKAGVFAVRAAPVLFRNLRAAVLGASGLAAFRPQRDYLKLVSTGGRTAVADKWGLAVAGPWVWRWKDRIDRRFIARFRDLPSMAVPAGSVTPAAESGFGQPLCGGCGAKVGRSALRAALDRLPPPGRADVVLGAGDDAAVLARPDGYQVMTTDHLRAFADDPWLMARIAAVHALGDVWSMGARPQVALAQIILPLMAPRQQAEMLREIMAAAETVFGPEGADIVGGHTSLGAELTLGFTVTGLSDRPPLLQSNARPGDRLILTKRLGTGVVLAAEMAGRAEGRWVRAAYDSMSRPSGPAARCLAPVAHAMTDITGFGLAGHLMAMLEASGAAAEIDMGALAVLPGAAELARGGVGSSLLPENRRVLGRMAVPQGPETDLLFDPQTAGGLLAAVPADRAGALVDRLADLGEEAAVIGEVTRGAPFLIVR